MSGYPQRTRRSAALARGLAGLLLLAASGQAQVTNYNLIPNYGNSASGAIQNFAATYQDGFGYADIYETDLLIATSPTAASACYVKSDTSGGFYLANDAGNVFLGPLASGGTLQNSQCTLYETGTSSSGFGSTYLTMNVSVSFTAAFAGAKYMYMQAFAGNGGSTGFQSIGSWTINASGTPDLTITKSHTGNFTQGQSGTYTIGVTNSGSATTSGLVTVTDTLPPAFTVATIGGSGWSCPSPPTCTRSDALAAGGSYPAITLTVNVASNAPASVTNNVGISGGGEANTSNDNASDPTTINSSGGGGGGGGANLALGKTATQSSTLNDPALPTPSKAVDGNTNGDFYGNSVTHTNSETNAWWQVDLGSSYALGSIIIWNRTNDCCIDRLSDYWVFVSDTPFLSNDTPTTLQNRGGTWSTHRTVAPNPSTTISTTGQGRYVRVQLTGTNYLSLAEVQVFGITTPRPDLTVTKTHSGSFTQGQSGVYTITVTNSGNAATTAAVTMIDTLPPGLTATSMSGGASWGCNVNTLTCTRSDVLNAGSSYAPITLNVSVANNAATGPVTSAARVTGGGETNLDNDNGSDTVTIVSGGGTPATMSSPTPGSVLSGSSVTFYWNAAASATGYELRVGSSSGGVEFFQGSAGANTSQPVSGITANGNPVYVKLVTTFSNGSTASNSYQYVAASGGPPDLTITKSHPFNFTQGQANATYTITVSNSGAGPTNGLVRVSDTLPPGLTASSISGGSSWSCTQPVGPCDRSDSLAAGSSYAPITLTVTVAANAAASVTNMAYVSGGGENNTGNDSASDVTTVNPNNGGTTDLAIGKPATQSSTYNDPPQLPVASLAVDGNTDGAYYNGSVTHTDYNYAAWWQVDLQSSKAVGSVVVWDRVDCCSERLNDYWVFISDTPFQPQDLPGALQIRAGTWSSHQTTIPTPSTTISTGGNVTGRYVRVQLNGQNYLNLAEVQVFGVTSGGTVAAPTSSLAPGNYSSTQMVTLSSATSGAFIRYTTDGSTPTSTVGTLYSGAISVSSSMTIKAIAYQAGWTDSSVSSWTYNITITITGDFAIQASPAAITLTSGASQTYIYTIGAIPIAGFHSDLNLQRDVNYDSIPNTGNTMAACGVLSVPSSIPWPTSVSVTITVDPQKYGTTCLPGNAYFLHLRAWAGSGVPQHYITLELDVAWNSDFSISTQYPTQTLSTGGTAYYQFTLHRIGGFGGQVNFTLSGLPAGVTASLSPQTVLLTGLDQSMVLGVSSSVSIPNFTLTATAPNNPQSTHGVPLSLVVQQGAPSPAMLTDMAVSSLFIERHQWLVGAGGPTADEALSSLPANDLAMANSVTAATNQQLDQLLAQIASYSGIDYVRQRSNILQSMSAQLQSQLTPASWGTVDRYMQNVIRPQLASMDADAPKSCDPSSVNCLFAYSEINFYNGGGTNRGLGMRVDSYVEGPNANLFCSTVASYKATWTSPDGTQSQVLRGPATDQKCFGGHAREPDTIQSPRPGTYKVEAFHQHSSSVGGGPPYSYMPVPPPPPATRTFDLSNGYDKYETPVDFALQVSGASGTYKNGDAVTVACSSPITITAVFTPPIPPDNTPPPILWTGGTAQDNTHRLVPCTVDSSNAISASIGSNLVARVTVNVGASDATVTASPALPNAAVLDDYNGQTVVPPNSGGPPPTTTTANQMAQLRTKTIKTSHGDVTIERGDLIDIGAFTYKWSRSGDRYKYTYIFDNSQLYMMRIGVPEDHDFSIGATSEAPKGWLFGGTDWGRWKEPEYFSRAEYSITSMFKPGLMPIFFQSPANLRGVPQFAETRDNNAIAAAANLSSNSLRQYAIGPAIDPKATRQEIMSLVRSWVGDYGFEFLEPLLTDRGSVEALHPSTELERAIVECLRMVL